MLAARSSATRAELGLAFQIVDDILDVEGASADLGKTAGKDAAAGKPTYPALYGLDDSRRLAADVHRRAPSPRSGRPGSSGQLPAIAALGRQPHELKNGIRLDALVVERGLAASRERARALILAGDVRVNGQPSPRPARGRRDDAEITLATPDHPYVGRGGVKLAHALDVFGDRPSTGRLGARHRRLDRRLHRRPPAARRARASSRSTSGTASSIGSCAAIRASSCSSASTRGR